MAYIWGETRGEDTDAHVSHRLVRHPVRQGMAGKASGQQPGAQLKFHFCHLLAVALGKTQTPHLRARDQNTNLAGLRQGHIDLNKCSRSAGYMWTHREVRPLAPGPQATMGTARSALPNPSSCRQHALDMLSNG